MSDEALMRVLEKFGDAWNRHDIDALMACMHNDCVFETVAGPEVYGARHDGPAAVRKAFEAAWQTIPDAQWLNAKVWVKGDQGVMESTFTGTAADGARIEANMVDLIVFRDGKILRKNAFRKNRPPIPAKV
ncbi:nuclear transport factor 2 family protein [Paralcaligenes sp. KSB-10]|jgi:ketosteroid isomerase-like protein|uniref:nuclear transport factor 2 family protein n=1 Tax=Paralcaligenes sp. KSB-10 TaxID=2901142 RepID=UPI001E343DC9|nr:nuclear transport factor 2 family protein [Paralcaligenes sp. KSB-10]UHL65940.1 nuclear transport factor 2 family protein [Paralcaligenes sp. KSB-10]